MLSRHFFFMGLGISVLVACSGGGEDDGGGGAGGVDDGKFPTAITEAEACDTLQNAYQQRVMDLGCGSKTVRTCPGFVRVIYDPDCVEFDQGSVQGCVDYWNGIDRCTDLFEDDCIATTYPGTEPAGCP